MIYFEDRWARLALLIRLVFELAVRLLEFWGTIQVVTLLLVICMEIEWIRHIVDGEITRESNLVRPALRRRRRRDDLRPAIHDPSVALGSAIGIYLSLIISLALDLTRLNLLYLNEALLFGIAGPMRMRPRHMVALVSFTFVDLLRT